MNTEIYIKNLNNWKNFDFFFILFKTGFEKLLTFFYVNNYFLIALLHIMFVFLRCVNQRMRRRYWKYYYSKEKYSFSNQHFFFSPQKRLYSDLWFLADVFFFFKTP